MWIVWVEVGSAPLDEFVVALVVGIGHRFKVFRITRLAADIFWRAGAFGLDQHGIGGVGCGLADAFDLDGVLPAVTEVVEILECLGASSLDDGLQRRLLGVQRSVAEPEVLSRRSNR